MIIRKIPRTDDLLRSFVEKHALFFHSSSWLDAYDDRLTQCAILNNNQEVIGCFLYFQFRKAGFRFIITPPWTPDIALFYVNPAGSVVGRNSFVKDLMKAVSSFLSAQGASHVSLNLPGSVNDSQPFFWEGFVPRVRHTYLLDLRSTEDQLKAGLSSEKRKSLARAEKDALEVRVANDHTLLLDLVLRSLSRNNKNRNTDILAKILKRQVNGPNAIAFAAWQEQRPIAATFCLTEGRRSVYVFGGFDGDNRHHGAGVSCMWQSILEAKRRGLDIFDFEGSMDPKIERYFREFGGTLATYQCVEKTTPLMKLLFRLKGHKPL